ncbi:Scr1 family TA system antitoxin-like transcriptional regulator [Embleya sp. NPDC059237]|uniref:Scr1 family TA system antitoxin-like transcriptional regulator n=1 Tax=Embleya sp. NPDC059237 TaxID=3346784 RepID=UPI00367EB2A9
MHTHVETNRTHLRRGAAHRQTQIRRIEAEARELKYFSPVVVPGLLQTTEYTRRLFALTLSGGGRARPPPPPPPTQKKKKTKTQP